jgi:hypothetical protein
MLSVTKQAAQVQSRHTVVTSESKIAALISIDGKMTVLYRMIVHGVLTDWQHIEYSNRLNSKKSHYFSMFAWESFNKCLCCHNFCIILI